MNEAQKREGREERKCLRNEFRDVADGLSVDWYFALALSTALRKIVAFFNAEERKGSAVRPALKEGFPPQATGEPEGRNAESF